MRQRSYLVVGCGRFGSQAVEKLLKKDPRSTVIVIDKRKKAIQRVSHLPVERVVGEGLIFLTQYLSEIDRNTFIIPAVPFHLAFELILSQLKPMGAKRKRPPLLSEIPRPMRGEDGSLFTSIADFTCPEDCPEPVRYCFLTKEKRGAPLYQTLGDLHGPFEARAIQSRQLGPGVGGFQVKTVLNLMEDVKKNRTRNRLFLISTACRCHGVVSALSIG